MPDSTATKEQSCGLVSAYNELRPQLLRFVTARTGDAGLAEDIVQDIALKLMEISTGPISNPSAYLHRIANNMIIDRARELRARHLREAAYVEQTTTQAAEEAVDDTPSVERALIAQDQLSRMMQAISSLPPAAAAVFRRHRIDGLSHTEIAAELGISRSAVEKSMAVAMKHLFKATKT